MKHSPVTPLIELARDIAFEAHTGQTRRDRETPYIVHPMTVAGKLQQAGEGEEVIAAALVHDALEDSGFTLADLRARGLPESVLLAVDVLAKRKGIGYMSYLTMVRANPIARKVKIADMLANLSDSPTPRQIRRYAEGLLYLTEEESAT